MTIPELLEEQAALWGDKPLIFCDDVTLSYAEMNQRSAWVAANLAARGVGQGDKIVTLLGNCLEQLYIFFGVGRIGAASVPINPKITPDEIAYIITNSDAESLVILPVFAPLVAAVRAKTPQLKHVFVVGDTPVEDAELFNELLKPVDAVPEICAKPDDEAALIYTSGTTGLPKGVILTHSNYIWNTRQITQVLDFRDDERFLTVLPLFHVNSQVISVLTPVMLGGDIVLMTDFAPFKILPLIEKYRCTVMSLVPTIYNVICRWPKAKQFDVSSMKFFVSGAAPMPEETHNLVQQVLHCDLVMGYGLTESTCGVAASDPRSPVRWQSVGPAFKHTRIRILDDAGNEAGINEVGEIVVSGPNIMKGYYKNPEATAEVLQDGWLKTGDLGRIDEDGYLYVVGRKKEMILRGGINVYPQQVETVLSTMPGIAECCVVGVDEPRWGQEILAVVQPADGVEMTEQDVIAFCKETIAEYRRPRFVRIVDELPKTATGKIRKNRVAEQFADVAKKKKDL